jgi:hypothetical protein
MAQPYHRPVTEGPSALYSTTRRVLLATAPTSCNISASPSRCQTTTTHCHTCPHNAQTLAKPLALAEPLAQKRAHLDERVVIADVVVDLDFQRGICL